MQTLANGREDLFGTVKNLQVFSDALVANDAQVRKFNTELDQVAGELADERGSLAATLKNLSRRSSDSPAFSRQNGNAIHTDVVGLKDVTGVLNKQKAALNEILAVAPVALANLAHTYNPVRARSTPATTSAAWPTRWTRCDQLGPDLANKLGDPNGTIAKTCDAVSRCSAGCRSSAVATTACPAAACCRSRRCPSLPKLGG